MSSPLAKLKKAQQKKRSRREKKLAKEQSRNDDMGTVEQASNGGQESSVNSGSGGGQESSVNSGNGGDRLSRDDQRFVQEFASIVDHIIEMQRQEALIQLMMRPLPTLDYPQLTRLDSYLMPWHDNIDDFKASSSGQAEDLDIAATDSKSATKDDGSGLGSDSNALPLVSLSEESSFPLKKDKDEPVSSHLESEKAPVAGIDSKETKNLLDRLEKPTMFSEVNAHFFLVLVGSLSVFILIILAIRQLTRKTPVVKRRISDPIII